jgi:hypothetical protein
LGQKLLWMANGACSSTRSLMSWAMIAGTARAAETPTSSLFIAA